MDSTRSAPTGSTWAMDKMLSVSWRASASTRRISDTSRVPTFTTTIVEASSTFQPQLFCAKARAQFAHWPPVHQRTIYVKADFDHPVRWYELNGSHDVFDDGSVVIFATPGHTPGHQSLLVRLEDSPLILAADAAYMTRNIELRRLPATYWHADRMVESWELLERMAERNGADIWVTHDIDFAERRKMAPDSWY